MLDWGIGSPVVGTFAASYTPSVESSTAMHYAAATGQIAAAAVLVSRYNHLVTHRDSDSNTPLHLASFGDHSTIASILLDNGAAPTELNNFNSTPLHMAALGQAKGTMAVLLHASTNYYFQEDDDVVNAVDDAGHSPLHKAIIVDDTKCAKLLLDSGADVNLQEVKEVESPLHTAAKSGHNDMTQLLLDYGADATQVTPEGFTTLHLAAASGSFDTVKTLLDNGFTHDGTFEDDSSVSPATTLGLLSRRPSESRIQTPLEIACSIGATDIASLLIDAGAEVSDEVIKAVQNRGMDGFSSSLRRWRYRRTGNFETSIMLPFLLTAKSVLDKYDIEEVKDCGSISGTEDPEILKLNPELAKNGDILMEILSFLKF